MLQVDGGVPTSLMGILADSTSNQLIQCGTPMNQPVGRGLRGERGFGTSHVPMCFLLVGYCDGQIDIVSEVVRAE